MSRPFEARYPGRCVVCDERIEPGDLLVFDDEAIHADCADKPEPSARPVCQKCWLVKPCDCEDPS